LMIGGIDSAKYELLMTLFSFLCLVDD